MANDVQKNAPLMLPSDMEAQNTRPIVESPTYSSKPKLRLPSDIPPPKPNYEEMPLYEAALKGVRALPGAIVESVTSIPGMIMNPSESIIQPIKQIGRGLLSSQAEKNLRALEEGAAGETGKKLAAESRARDVRTATQRAEEEEPYKRFIAPFTSYAGFKEALATDPLSVVPISGGPLRKVGSLIKGADTESLARKVIAAPFTAAGYAVDPVEGSLALTAGAAKKGAQLVKAGATNIVRIPEETLDIAYETGKARGPSSQAAKKSFTEFFSGKGNLDNFQTRAINAFEKIKSNAFQQWKQQKKGVMGQSGDVPFAPIIQAIDERRAMYGNYNLATEEGRRAIDALNQVKGNIVQRSMLPIGHPDRSVEAFDKYKIQLGMEANANPSLSSDYMAAYNGVKNAINEIAPDYQNLMDTYREMNRHMVTLQKAIKAKDTNTALDSFNAFNKLLKTPEGMKLANEINAVDPTILPSVAGAVLSREMPILQGAAETGMGGALLSTIGFMYSGMPLPAAISLSAVPVLASIPTPKRLGSYSYRAGQIAGSPVGKGLGAATSLARDVASPTVTFMENLRRTQEDLENYPEIRATGGRVGRANGGRIEIQQGVRALMRAMEDAKKSVTKSTENLLQMPDEHIAKALDAAKRNI